MDNLVLAWSNQADTGTLSGGTWSAALPQANMINESLSTVARTGGISLNITKFTMDLGAGRLIALIGIIAHTMSVDAKIKITASNNANMMPLLHDSGWLDVVPAIWGPESGGLWGIDSVWTGKYLESELEGMTKNFFHMPSAAIIARYVEVEMDDLTNAAGVIDIGRLFVGPAWESTNNFNIDARLGWRDLSISNEGLDGVMFSEEHTKKRFFQFGLSFLEKNETMAQAFELQRRQGTTKQIIVIPYPNDVTHQFREAFIGHLRTLSPVEIRQVGFHTIGFELEEITG